MALFNRRSKNDANDAQSPASDIADAGTVDLPEGFIEEVVPQVGISVSTFGQAAQPVRRKAAAPETAPAAATVGGLIDNSPLKAALAALPEKPENMDVMNVMRQALQGHAYVRVQGDVRELLAAGKDLTLAVTTLGENRFLLAYTGGDAMQAAVKADGDTATSAVGQPLVNILRSVLAGPYAGMILDHSIADARIVLPTQLIEKALEEADPDFTIKTALCAERTDMTPVVVSEALTRVKLWVAGGTAGDSGQIGLAEARTADGQRRLEIFSHPLEVIAMGRGDRPLPITGEQLGKALAADPGLTGVVVDPAGPWIQLDREALASVIALAG